MTENYWKFILGLQHNAQLYFDSKIDLYQIDHDWCRATNDLFMVRDLETNELLYDSVAHLITTLNDQKIYYSGLIPSHTLFTEPLSCFKKLIFDGSNYPMAVFLGHDENFALVKVEAERCKVNVISSDPREFSGFVSSQEYDKYLLFTLIKLDQKQLHLFEQFNQGLDWKMLHEEFQNEFLSSKFNFTQDKSLRLTNNLFLEESGKDSPFLTEVLSESNLAFSWVNKLSELRNQLNHEISMLYQDRSFHSDILLNETEVTMFEEHLNDALISLLSHTANDYQKAYLHEDFIYIPLNIVKSRFDHNLDTNDELENEPNIEEKQGSLIASIIHIILFLVIVVGLLYGVFWLISHYEFAKFVVITIAVIAFLTIWSRK